MSLDVYLDLDVCSHCGRAAETAFSANVTGNLARMAQEAGLYAAMWEPETIGVTTAADLAPHLTEGLATLQAFPERFTPFNPENGWGSYAGLVVWTARYLSACIEYPMATVRVSR